MLIKIDENRYINSDHIVMMETGTDSCLYMTNTALLHADPAIILYIAGILDAHDALTTAQPQKMALRSRLAIHLRNQSAGQSLAMITTAFPDIDTLTIEVALHELNVNNVIHALGEDDNRLFYHASNPIFGHTIPPEGF